MKRFLFNVLILIMILSPLFALSDSNKLIVGMELAYPPFETKDENGKASGISVDIANDFAKSLGRELVIENISWDGLLPALQTSKVDMVISSMTITPERSNVVDFSKPYANALLAILANKNSNINSYEDLNNKNVKLALKIGSTAYLYALEHLDKAEIIGLSDESACITEVLQGKADAFIYDQLTIYRNYINNIDSTKVIYMNHKDAEHWGVAFKKGNSELLDAMNSFIDEYRKSGGFDKISQKYLAEEKKAFDEYGFLWFFDENDK